MNEEIIDVHRLGNGRIHLDIWLDEKQCIEEPGYVEDVKGRILTEFDKQIARSKNGKTVTQKVNENGSSSKRQHSSVLHQNQDEFPSLG